MHARSVLLPLCLAGALAAGVGAPAVAAPRAAAVDADRDRMPDRWERAHGLNPGRAADARADGDRDGLKNLVEYRLGSDPADEDSDDDGQDDADERTTRTRVAVADTDRDGVLDGDEDHDRDGVANEDEDDARESCAREDDDLDGDHVADEDEDELGLARGDADADDDGTTDGHEDADGDGDVAEDEDDVDDDRCAGDADGDGRADEDEDDVLGTVAAFDPATGVLSLTGSDPVLRVTGDTEIEVELVAVTAEGAQRWDERDGSVADLTPGVEVAEVDVRDGDLREVTLRVAEGPQPDAGDVDDEDAED